MDDKEEIIRQLKLENNYLKALLKENNNEFHKILKKFPLLNSFNQISEIPTNPKFVSHKKKHRESRYKKQCRFTECNGCIKTISCIEYACRCCNACGKLLKLRKKIPQYINKHEIRKHLHHNVQHK